MNNRRVLSNSVLYSFNSSLLKGVNLLLLKVYTAYLTPTDYGITDLVTSFTAVATYLVAMSLYSALRRYYLDYKDDLERLKRFYGTVICFVFLTSAVFLALSLVFRGTLIRLFFEGCDFLPTVLLALVGFLFGCQHMIYQSIMQGMQNGKKFTVTSIIYFFVNVSLNLLFVVGFKWGANGMLAATLAVNVMFFVFMLIDLKHSGLVTFCIDKELLRVSLKYSMPMIPHDISNPIAVFFSKIILNKNYDLDSVGVYALASKLGDFANLIQAGVNMAYAPWFFEKMREGTPEAKREINRMVTVLLWFYGVVILGIGLFSQEAVYLLTTPEYRMAWTVVPLLTIAFSIKTIYYFYWDILTYYEKATKLIFLATLTGSLVNIFAYALLIPKYDMYGSGIAQIISKIVTSVITVLLCRRFEGADYNLKQMVGMIFLNASFTGIGLFFSYTRYMDVFSVGNFLFKLAVFAVYVCIALFSMKNDVNMAIGLLKKKLKIDRST